MCGICGIVGPGPPETEAVERMAEALAHRGPDASGVYAADGVALAGRRLAILDLSDAGRQPFASEDGRFRLVHNGEIYNYLELRAELEAKGHRFHSGTDTEVVLAAYREWGPHCVDRLLGMWAFAVWDAAERRLFCSRDRFGIKPFYYRFANGRFVLASELKAFHAAGEPLAANERVVRDYLEHGLLDHTEETFFAGILELLPAHSLTLDHQGLQVERYWRLEPREPPREPAQAVRELFLDAVRLHLRSDVPIGTCLSGGIDSSAIACAVHDLLAREPEAARQVGERQRTFTAWFDGGGYDERPYAESVVAQTGAEPRWVSFSARELVERLPAIVEALDAPFGSTSIAAQWSVMRSAREAGLKVMLDGQGGDEVFGGYPVFQRLRLADLLASARLRELGAELAAQRRLVGARASGLGLARALLPPRAERLLRARVTGARALVHPELARLPQPALEEADGFPDRMRRRAALMLTRRGLRELLRYEDRNSMTHSLEARVPLLDHRLVELALSLDARHLVERGRTKAVLREALADLLPPVVRERTDKLGFVTPEREWLRGALGELALEVFSSRRFAERGFSDTRACRRRVERHRRGQLEAGQELWRALNLELWACTFLDR